jgi:trans-aconitate methyltransferase
MSAAWDASLYAQNTAHHRAYDAVLFEGVDLTDTRFIVDVGCGSGDFTRSLLDRAPLAHIVGADADAGMIAAAQTGPTNPRLDFVQCPAQELHRVVEPGSADVIFSVAALHWINESEHPQILRELRATLTQGGVLRAQFGGLGQVAEPQRILEDESSKRGPVPHPWFFPSAEHYGLLLTEAGFDLDRSQDWVRLLHQRRSFDAESIIAWFDSQAIHPYASALPESERDGFRASVHQRVLTELRREDDSYDLDFVRLDLRVHR